jgi:hypothetical protein
MHAPRFSRLFLVAALMAMAAAFAGAAVASTGGDDRFVLTTGITPTTSLHWTVGGMLSNNGHALAGQTVDIIAYTGLGCVSENARGQVQQTTDANGMYTSNWSGPAGGIFSFKAKYSSPGGHDVWSMDCASITLAAFGPTSTPPPPNHMPLCYSSFDMGSGQIFTVDKALSVLKDPSSIGWVKAWVPYAVKGAAPSSNNMVVGSYYLTCQVPAGMKLTGLYHGADGPGSSDSFSSMDTKTAGAAEFQVAQ